MALSKFKKMLVDDEYDDDNEEEETKETKSKSKVVSTPGNISGKMILLEPRAYSESQQIADHLKKKNTVVVNMKRVTPDQAKRIVDFLSGTVYALEGDLQKIGAGIFLCTPKNVDVEGAITDDEDKAKSKKSTDDNYIEW
ncbi:MAG: cell division protein SepF [Bacilli bacterium]|nr:cell division protein SepF [Bacilli bacterium]